MRVGTLAVRHHATSAAVVRHSIADDLAGNAVSRDSINDVVLVASELVGNAVVHTGDTAGSAVEDPDLDVSWELEPASVVIRVYDRSGDLPLPRTADDSHTGGRGLAIVAAIALDWGVLRRPEGKQVWARVPVDLTR